MDAINKQTVAYGFISVTSATYPDEVLGERLGELFMAIDNYETYLEECIAEDEASALGLEWRVGDES